MISYYYLEIASILVLTVILYLVPVHDRRMWAQPVPSTQRHEIRICVNVQVYVNVDCDCNELKVCNTKENVCVCIAL
jgi:hypothetical protein